ncbi:23682_t:CDS:2, partial [Gigaspora margarita]
FVSIEESGILQNIERNNGITVFIPQGYTLILIHEDATKQLKIIKKLPELRIYEIIKDNPKINTRQISKIAGSKWNKLSEYEKSRYKL